MATLIRCLIVAVSFVGLSFGGTVFAKGDACASVKAKAECSKKSDCSWNGKHCAAKAAKAGKKAAAAAKPAAAKPEAKAPAKTEEAPAEAPAEDPGMGEEPVEEDTEG